MTAKPHGATAVNRVTAAVCVPGASVTADAGACLARADDRNHSDAGDLENIGRRRGREGRRTPVGQANAVLRTMCLHCMSVIIRSENTGAIIVRLTSALSEQGTTPLSSP